jgi:hypothetical protein
MEVKHEGPSNPHLFKHSIRMQPPALDLLPEHVHGLEDKWRPIQFGLFRTSLVNIEPHRKLKPLSESSEHFSISRL